MRTMSMKRFTISLADGDYKEVIEEAMHNNRTLNGQIQFIVEDWLEKERRKK
jgi:hypothetical protein